MVVVNHAYAPRVNTKDTGQPDPTPDRILHFKLEKQAGIRGGDQLSPHHYVMIEGADHYLGGRICRTDVPGPPQHEALRIAAATSTTFLDAYVKNDLNAWRSMRFGDLNEATKGKATLTLR